MSVWATARFLADAGVRVIAVSDQYGGIVAPAGLDVRALEAYMDETGSVVGFASPVDDLLTIPVELLVPAAVEGVIRAGNAPSAEASVIVEGANGLADHS